MSLVGKVNYHAYSYGNMDLAILAAGLNPKAGYINEIVEADIGFKLVNTPPNLPTIEVVSLFACSKLFNEGGDKRSIDITDDNGTHQVQVHLIKDE